MVVGAGEGTTTVPVFLYGYPVQFPVVYPDAPTGYVKVTFVLLKEFLELSVLLPYATEGAVVAAI